MGERVPVLIVGGSLVGLSMAVFLADRGVRCTVVERHQGTAIHPRARGYTARTMEVFRGVGLEAAVRGAGTVGAQSGALIRARTLADEHFEELARPEAATPPGLSPCAMFACDQDRLEPILLERARELGAEVRFGTELTGFAQDADQVTATVLDRRSRTESVITADYLVAADGVHSRIRDALGIGLNRIGQFGSALSILFTADLEEVARDRHFFACVVDAVEGGILVRRDDRRWQLAAAFHPERGELLADYTEERCAELVRAAVGVPSLEVTVTDVLPWEVSAQAAERLAAGRVFLAGDAAHSTTPWGGLGANTGIQDAHNLAWKLAAVLEGGAATSLLASYHAERHPVAELTVAYAVSLLRREPGALDRYAAVTLGYRYLDGAIARGGEAAGGHDGKPIEDPAHPSGSPGTRAPHLRLARSGAALAGPPAAPAAGDGAATGELSTLDLFGRGFVLLAGPDGARWCEAAEAIGGSGTSGVTAHILGKDEHAGLVDLDGRWCDAYGVGIDGAVLVRPDGFIAWRAGAAVADPHAELRAALATVLGHAPSPTPEGAGSPVAAAPADS